MAGRNVILGEGGHARAMQPYIEDAGFIGHEGGVRNDDVVFIGVGDMETRVELFNAWKDQVPHKGITLMPNAFIHPTVKFGVNVLVNTGAQIDHDCVIGDHCIISPGAILCGGLTLGEKCQIGAGAIILQGVKLDAETKIPAGTLVVGQNDLRRPGRVLQD